MIMGGSSTVGAFALAACAAFSAALVSCHSAPPAQSTPSTHPASRPATQPANAAHSQPATAAAVDQKKIDFAPVLVVWHKDSSGVNQWLECAAWDDGLVLYRRRVPRTGELSMFVGRVNKADVAETMQGLDEHGFFRGKPFVFAPNGTTVMARDRGRGNSLTVDWDLKPMPEKPQGGLTAEAIAQRDLWTVIVDQTRQLREVIDDEPLSKNLDSKGEYRGYNPKNPADTWWIKDGEKLWHPTSAPPASSKSTPSR